VAASGGIYNGLWFADHIISVLFGLLLVPISVVLYRLLILITCFKEKSVLISNNIGMVTSMATLHSYVLVELQWRTDSKAKFKERL